VGGHARRGVAGAAPRGGRPPPPRGGVRPLRLGRLEVVRREEGADRPRPRAGRLHRQVAEPALPRGRARLRAPPRPLREVPPLQARRGDELRAVQDDPPRSGRLRRVRPRAARQRRARRAPPPGSAQLRARDVHRADRVRPPRDAQAPVDRGRGRGAHRRARSHGPHERARLQAARRAARDRERPPEVPPRPARSSRRPWTPSSTPTRTCAIR